MADLNTAYLDNDAIQALGFASVGRNVRIHSTAVIANCAAISLGSHVRIDAFSLISAGAGISLGDHVHIGSHCSLVGSASITLADFCGVSHGSRIFSASDDYSGGALTGPTIPPQFRNVQSGPVRLARHVIIGSNSVILPNVEIGEGCAVGASSLVVRSLESWNIYAGCPARRIGMRRKELLDQEEALRALERGT